MEDFRTWMTIVAIFGVIPMVPLVYFIVRKVQARRLGIKGIPSPWTIVFWLAFVLSFYHAFLTPRVQCKSRISEARTNLGAIYTTQVWYFGENKTYGNTFTTINWAPEGESLYTYYIGDDSITNTKGTPILYRTDGNWPFKIHPGASATGFTAIAIGNIDNDEFVDAWMITDDKKITRILDDSYDEDTANFLADPQSLYDKYYARLTRFLDNPLNLLLFTTCLLILSIIDDEVRWRRVKLQWRMGCK